MTDGDQRDEQTHPLRTRVGQTASAHRELAPRGHDQPLSVVLALFRADARRDLVRYQQVLAADVTVTELGGDLVLGADAEAAAAARRWAQAPHHRTDIADAVVVGDLVLVRLTPAPGAAPRSPSASVYRVADGRVAEIWRYDETPSERGGALAADPHAARPRPEAARSRVETVFRTVAIVLGVVAYAVWDEIIFSVPVVAMAAWAGPWAAFVSFTALYSAIGFGLSIWLTRIVARRSTRTPRRHSLEAMAARQAESARWDWLRNLLRRSWWLGLPVAGTVIGGIATTFLVARLDLTRNLRAAAAIANIVWAVTFVGLYAGLAAIVF